MGVKIEAQNIGDPIVASEIAVIIEHVFSGLPGEWHLSIIGSRESDNWEMQIQGPAGFERSYSLIGAAGQHEPGVIQQSLPRLLPASKSE